MALARKKAPIIALDPDDDRLLSRAAQERGVISSRAPPSTKCFERPSIRHAPATCPVSYWPKSTISCETNAGPWQVFTQDVARGAFTYAPPTSELSRAMEVDRLFADLDLGLVDGSVLALAETLGVRRLTTRDVRHFAAVRLGDGRAFDLVLHPRDPDTS